MDLSAFELPVGLTKKQTREWVRNIGHCMLADENGAPSANGVKRFAPSDVKKNKNVLPLSRAFAQWVASNQILENSDGYWRVGMKGCGVVNASLTKRKTLNKAWDEVARMLARVAWNNHGSSQVLPLTVRDVLLFGSLTDPAKADYGDADLVLVTLPHEKTQDNGVDIAPARLLASQVKSFNPFLSLHGLEQMGILPMPRRSRRWCRFWMSCGTTCW